jgi:hypothetical protein
LLRSPYYKAFNPRVFETVVGFDLLDVEGGGVRLATRKAMELATMLREVPDWGQVVDEERVVPGFHRPEAAFIRTRLQDATSPGPYIWDTDSDAAHMGGYRESVASETGKGPFGSSGVKKGKVEEDWVQGVTHPIPLEKPKEAAEVLVPGT